MEDNDMPRIKISAYVSLDDSIIEIDEGLTEEEIWAEVNYYVAEYLQVSYEVVE